MSDQFQDVKVNRLISQLTGEGKPLPIFRGFMIDEQHQTKFENVWENGNYRHGSTAQRLLQRLMGWIPEEATIIDYGCGTGRMEVELNKLYDARDLLLDGFNKALKKVEASTAESNSLAVAIATVENAITELGGCIEDAE